MKNLLLFVIFLAFMSICYPESRINNDNLLYSVIKAQVALNTNICGTWVWNTGVFNQDLRTNSTPGFEWPRVSGKFAIFSTGLSMGTYINGTLRLASVSYNGEYAPGHVSGGIGVTDVSFKLYRIVRGDNNSTNPDYANWGLMVPYGAPYDDVNLNGMFDAGIDKPGVKNASMNVFVCLTDAFPENHTVSEGFSGGTVPVFAEMHMSAWAYDNISPLTDVQFLKMEIVNRNDLPWTKTYFGIVSDPDLGESGDDYIGCDTIRNLGYCYNATNLDGSGGGVTYGANPPAVGFDLLKGAINRTTLPVTDIKMSSFVYMINTGSGGLSCESDPGSVPARAYNFLRGMKRDTTPYVNPANMNVTKYCFPGDPETGSGWTEYTGKVDNCGGAASGNIISSPPGDRRFILGSGASNLTIAPGEKQIFVIAQMIARGSNNRNSVTKLKQLDDSVQIFYNNNLLVSTNNPSFLTPKNFFLYQNYPNPFNPSTKIKFEIPRSNFVKLAVYDLSGKLIEELVNENLNAGTYEVKFVPKNISSGIYFYKLSASSYTDTKKLILLK